MRKLDHFAGNRRNGARCCDTVARKDSRAAGIYRQHNRASRSAAKLDKSLSIDREEERRHGIDCERPGNCLACRWIGSRLGSVRPAPSDPDVVFADGRARVRSESGLVNQATATLLHHQVGHVAIVGGDISQVEALGQLGEGEGDGYGLSDPNGRGRHRDRYRRQALRVLQIGHGGRFGDPLVRLGKGCGQGIRILDGQPGRPKERGERRLIEKIVRRRQRIDQRLGRKLVISPFSHRSAQKACHLHCRFDHRKILGACIGPWIGLQLRNRESNSRSYDLVGVRSA